ncbi:MAG: chalcone isomerase family protein [Alphaproteobacteria bacterium]|nr:chalcone isomerase family protein [Alphaproteobacteria bacterium]
MRKHIRFIIALIMLVTAFPAMAAPTYVADHIPSAQIMGMGRFTYMMMDIYDVRLYAPGGAFNPNQPFALSLTYLRKLYGLRIADRSIEEIRDLGFNDEITLAAWHNSLRKIFPDVQNGDTLTGIRDPQGRAIFYNNNIKIGHIDDPEFSKWFFGIWLSPQTSHPSLRSRLLNGTE